jgi:acetyltransferase-like isoleucine patch superfamily enzyme
MFSSPSLAAFRVRQTGLVQQNGAAESEKMLKRLAAFIHRRIDPISYARSIGVKVGQNCRLIDVDFGSEPWLIVLGDHVSASDVSFVTHDGGVWIFRDEFPDIDVLAPIRIGNNVFIGSRTLILPGVTVGNDVVIGAGSVVTRNLPAGQVYAGVPARRLSSIVDYREKVIAQSVGTKGMSAKQKRDAMAARSTPDETVTN